MTKKSVKTTSVAQAKAPLPFYRLIPNIITLMALSAGLTSVRFAIDERWMAAMVAILIAALLDSLDGAAARLLKSSSPLGMQLDSLSDFVSFGIAPSIIIYLWVMTPKVILGWAFCLIFAIAMALRLARFNVRAEEASRTTAKKKERYYFEGVPAPAGAILALLPLYASFEIGRAPLTYSPFAIGIWIAFVASLMLSQLPTYSVKGLHLPRKAILPVMGTVGAVLASLINEPWTTLVVISIVYLLSIPVCYFRVARKSSLSTTKK